VQVLDVAYLWMKPKLQFITHPSGKMNTSDGAIAVWSQEFPEMFDGSCGTHKPPYARIGTPENFPNYALMYLLRKNDGVHSITYFRLGSKASKDGNRLQVIMRKWMG